MNSRIYNKDDFAKLYEEGLFDNPNKWGEFVLSPDIQGLTDGITSRMKYSMSKMSLGIFNVLDKGPFQNIKPEDEIFLFTGFAEIETVNKIGKLIMEQDYSINPALFPNSVAHVALSYFTILKKINNYTVAINDGLNTNNAFIDFIIDRSFIPVDYIVASGEEDSLFFSYEINKKLDIVPSFAAYKVETGKDRGFKFLQTVYNINGVVENSCFTDAANVFCCRTAFDELSVLKTGKKLFTEYPLVKDNPCGIIFRLAMPFLFDKPGKSLVIEKIKNAYHLFEVAL